MLFCFLSVCLCWRQMNMNLYEFVPGKWEQKHTNETKIEFEMQEIADNSNASVKKFAGKFGENDIHIDVMANNSAHFAFLNNEFDIDFIDEDDDVARADLDLESGYHLSVTVTSTYSFEIVLVKKGTNDILYYGFSKNILQSSWKEVVVCLALSVILTYFIRKYGKMIRL